MPKSKHRPKVCGIDGPFEPGVITQEELKRMDDLQKAVWLIQRTAQKRVMEIEARLCDGARIELGTLTFDREFHRVLESSHVLLGRANNRNPAIAHAVK